MIRWEGVAPKLIDVFTKLSRFAEASPAWRARWADEPHSFTDPKQRGDVVLAIVSVADIGATEVRRVLVGGQPREMFVGQRRVGLDVKVESHDHSPSYWCHTTAERIRTLLNRASVRTSLLADNIGVTNVGATRPATYKFDSRHINAVLFEVTLAVGFQTTPTAEDNIDTIEHIRATAQFANSGGVNLGEPPNYTDLLMPPSS